MKKIFINNKKLILVFMILSFILLNLTIIQTNKKQAIVEAKSMKNIVVLGSEPEAITSAVINSRLGYNVYMITEDENLGGLFTEGMLTAFDINYYPDKVILHSGFFDELYENASNGYNLDLNKTQEFFDRVVEKENINLVKSATNITPIVNSQGKLTGVYYEKDGQSFEVDADFVFDGSYEAEFTRSLGAEYKTGRSEFGMHNEYAAAGIMFSLNGVDWEELKSVIKGDDDPETGINQNAAWGFKEMYNYTPTDEIFKMRGLNISRQDDGSIVLNALLVLGVDPLDETSYSDVIKRAEKEIPLIVEYMRKNLKGFENATLDKIANDLYIREGVRIIGEETLDGYDIVAHTKFDDVIGYGSYPADLQTSTKENYGNALNGRSVYEIPLGAVMPKGIENVVVLGRCASFDIVAHSSARTVPVLMSIAQGATYAVDYALENNLSLSEVRENYMSDVHDRMKSIGNMNMPSMPENEYEDSFSNEAIEFLRKKGLITTKYFETLPIDENANFEQIRSIINLAKEYTQIEFTNEQSSYIKSLEGTCTKEDLVKLISILVNKNYISFEEMKEDGVLSEDTFNRLSNDKVLINAHIYCIMSDYVKYMQKDFTEVISKEELNVIIKDF